MTAEVAIIKRLGTRGYLVRVTPDGSGLTASGRPMMTHPWEFGPFRTLQGARKRAQLAADEYCTPGQQDTVVEVVEPLSAPRDPDLPWPMRPASRWGL